MITEPHPPWPECPEPQLWTAPDEWGVECEVSNWLTAMVELLKPRVLIETGAGDGYSTVALARGCKSNGFGHVTSTEKQADKVANARSALADAGLSDWATVIEASDVRRALGDDEVDLLFVDSYQPLRVGEIEAVMPQMSVRCVVIAHDTSPVHHTVRSDLDAMMKSGRLHVVHLPTPRGLSIARRAVEVTNESWGRIAVGVRHGGYVHPKFVEHWSRFLRHGMRPSDGLLPAAIRLHHQTAFNFLADYFTNAPECRQYDSMLLVDDDQIIPPLALEQLRRRSESQQYDMVSAVIPMRDVNAVVLYRLQPPYRYAKPLEYYAYETVTGWQAGSVVEVDCLGCGFTLYKRHVFERVAPPWQEYSQIQAMGADVIFSRKAQLAGLRMAVDTSVSVGHLCSDTTTWATAKEGEGVLQLKCDLTEMV